jgi:ABC-type multidrug transport system fused ATPase/permease subunit
LSFYNKFYYFRTNAEDEYLNSINKTENNLALTSTTITSSNSPPEEVDESYYTIFYSSIVGAMFVTVFIRSITFFSMCMRASVNLHNRIFSRILRAPMSMFDNNPVGRILNRFTKDLGTIDETMPGTAFDLNLVSKLFTSFIVKFVFQIIMHIIDLP